MPNRAIVFVSEAIDGLTSAHLSKVMADAERFNRTAGVTGVTLFEERRFLTYMEGPHDGLHVAFSRAAGATSHSSLIEIARGRVGQRRLPYWPMRCIPVSPPELVQLVRADWTGFLQRGGNHAAPVSAMQMLLALVEPFAEAHEQPSAWHQACSVVAPIGSPELPSFISGRRYQADRPA